jgi:hypothetical protein
MHVNVYISHYIHFSNENEENSAYKENEILKRDEKKLFEIWKNKSTIIKHVYGEKKVNFYFHILLFSNSQFIEKDTTKKIALKIQFIMKNISKKEKVLWNWREKIN